MRQAARVHRLANTVFRGAERALASSVAREGDRGSFHKRSHNAAF